ncbi:hypothetical protein Pmar_PMAR006410 [Perkinsus marinus ATCC 50983]|uniref:Endonuclease/exonuclease/phosphatase domain-containing protein n=1 Tax=Perkinsus marinus (strain ATCC 50983 / TXsc) TaxID=423536 RepID=C5K9L8_PERM5|nr:hypothetical protein Pmar_PMAR006410 [Perkinsus marinus ATCC 50983]EER18790.1 hypothetical protein Pmar_PMAR006410 [Perkinsus marinus ATCC 50983]|eukprot:XP_002786994.1 hypothetical protein Pmar_PMAR006410 [Perkinsus marinus ATCC 50983]
MQCILCAYRPPNTTHVEHCLRGSFHKITAFKPICVLAIGDFNKHSLDSLFSTTRSLGLSQIVREPTHIHGGTLDMVFTSSDTHCFKAKADPIEARISDHSCVVTTIPITLTTDSSEMSHLGPRDLAGTSG